MKKIRPNSSQFFLMNYKFFLTTSWTHAILVNLCTFFVLNLNSKLKLCQLCCFFKTTKIVESISTIEASSTKNISRLNIKLDHRQHMIKCLTRSSCQKCKKNLFVTLLRILRIYTLNVFNKHNLFHLHTRPPDIMTYLNYCSNMTSRSFIIFLLEGSLMNHKQFL